MLLNGMGIFFFTGEIRMKRILNAIYNGQLNPSETIVLHDRKYRMNLEKQVELSSRLSKTFTPEQHRLFETLQQQESKNNAYLLEKTFCKGFQIGAKIMIELKGR